MATTETKNEQHHAQEFSFTAEIQQLLHILIHSIYTHKEIFLRELVSNASDALSKIRTHMLKDQNVLSKDSPLAIHITIDKDKGTLSVRDTGVGMTRDEIVTNIGTIAHSGTKKFLQQLGQENKGDINLIGQFGVGFYSVFMVADKVTLTTRAYHPDSQAYTWTSDGSGKYTIAETEQAERGTSITVHLKEDAKNFLEEWTIRNIIRKYSDFVSFPIYLGTEQINKLSAIWTRSASKIKEEEYQEFYKYLTHSQENPLDYIHMSFDAPIQFYSVLYIPKEVPWDLKYNVPEKWKGLHLYVRRVFIQADCEDLLPQYMRFIRGVVDTDDLPLNISRETLQENQIVTKIQKNIVRKVLDRLETMAQERKQDYENFWRNFGNLFKQGARTDYENKSKILNLLRFNSSHCANESELVSLKDYVSRMRPNQKDIYFLSGESREAIEKRPHMEIFRKKGVEVLFLTEPFDEFLLMEVPDYEGHKFISSEKEEVTLNDIENKEEPKDEKKEQEEASTDREFADLLVFFKDTLKNKVEDVRESKRLVDSPCCLVSGKDAMDVNMQKLMKMMNEKFEMTKRILELNRKHPLITQMAKMYGTDPRNPALHLCCEQLLDNALLLDGAPIQPHEMVPRLQKLMEFSVKHKES